MRRGSMGMDQFGKAKQLGKMTAAQRKRASSGRARRRQSLEIGMDEAFVPQSEGADDQESAAPVAGQTSPMRQRKSSMVVQQAARASAARKNEEDEEINATEANADLIKPLAAISGDIAAKAKKIRKNSAAPQIHESNPMVTTQPQVRKKRCSVTAASVESLLDDLGLSHISQDPEAIMTLRENGFTTVESLQGFTWRDLKDFGLKTGFANEVSQAVSKAWKQPAERVELVEANAPNPSLLFRELKVATNQDNMGLSEVSELEQLMVKKQRKIEGKSRKPSWAGGPGEPSSDAGRKSSVHKAAAASANRKKSSALPDAMTVTAGGNSFVVSAGLYSSTSGSLGITEEQHQQLQRQHEEQERQKKEPFKLEGSEGRKPPPFMRELSAGNFKLNKDAEDHKQAAANKPPNMMAAIREGSFKLNKVQAEPKAPPRPNDMMAMIRSGSVKLNKVDSENDTRPAYCVRPESPPDMMSLIRSGSVKLKKSSARRQSSGPPPPKEPDMMSLIKVGRGSLRSVSSAADAQEEENSAGNGGGPCSNYRLDLTGATFGVCKCGFPKSDHK